MIALATAIGAVVLPAAAHTEAVLPAVAHTEAVITIAPAASGVLEPGQELVLDGMVSNPTGTIIPAGSATVSLNRAPLSSRAGLASWLAPESTSANDRLDIQLFETPTPEVRAGETISLQLKVPAASIDLGVQAAIWGTRTLAVRITAGGVEVGQARTSIVWYPGGAVQPTRLAIAMPLTVPQGSDGLIPPDLLASYTAPGGLLSRELDQLIGPAVEQNVAIGIDPRIIASIRILNKAAPPSAIAWLARLDATSNDSFALSYADSDLAAASQARAPRVLAPDFLVDPTLFPGAPTQSPEPQTASPTPAPSVTPVTPVPDAVALQKWGYAVDAVAWPADRTVVGTDLDNFEASGLTTTILASDNVAYDDLNYTPSAAAKVGKHNALIADSILSSLLRAASSATTQLDWEKAMSALSSAIAVVGRERPTDSRTLLATLDRRDPGGQFFLHQTLEALAGLPWASSARITDLTTALATTAVAATVTARPEPAERIATVTRLLASEAAAGSFSSTLVTPLQITAERRLSLLAILANSWLSDQAWASAADKYVSRSTVITNSVTIVKSSSLLITATNAPIPVTVSNTLPWPVVAYVTVRSPTGILSVANDRVELTIEADSQAKVNVPVKSNANGNTTVEVSLTSATNVPIGQVAYLNVDVQAQWESAFTAVVAVLLVGVFGFGIWRNIAKRRKAKKTRATDDSNPDNAPADYAQPGVTPADSMRP